MFNGALLMKTRKTLPGSLKQGAWTDTWTDTIDFRYEGEITPEVERAIIRAFLDRQDEIARRNSGSYQAALRRPNPDRVLGVDKVNRVLLIECSCQLAD